MDEGRRRINISMYESLLADDFRVLSRIHRNYNRGVVRGEKESSLSKHVAFGVPVSKN